jgi:hypothetical protein
LRKNENERKFLHVLYYCQHSFHYRFLHFNMRKRHFCLYLVGLSNNLTVIFQIFCLFFFKFYLTVIFSNSFWPLLLKFEFRANKMRFSWSYVAKTKLKLFLQLYMHIKMKSMNWAKSGRETFKYQSKIYKSTCFMNEN